MKAPEIAFSNCLNHHYHSFIHSTSFWPPNTEPGLDPVEAKPLKARSSTSDNHREDW